MKLRVISDSHLEAFNNPIYKLVDIFLPEHEEDKDSTLVLAGDISSRLPQLQEFILAVKDRFQNVLYVPGNHELYKHDATEWNPSMNTFYAAQGILGVDTFSVKSYELNGIKFILATLWGDGGTNVTDNFTVEHFLNDFRLIRNDVHKFNVFDMVHIHKAQRSRIREELEGWEGKIVVITHHLPSRKLVSDRFWPADGSDGANGGFVGDCTDILLDFKPDLWIHGHTHDEIDTVVHDTRVVCSPVGYRGEWGNQFNKVMSAINGRPVAIPKFVEI